MNLEIWLGEIAALTGALLWAIASVLYGRVGQKISPLVLNLLKGAIAIGLLGVTLWIQRAAWPQVSGVVTLQLGLSGLIGIGLGDTAYLAALRNLGARRALLLETLAPPFSVILARVVLREQLSGGAIAGILITLAGVGWVISERTPAQQSAQPSVPTPSRQRWGLVWGLLAELAQASGAVLSRSALANSSITPLWSSLLRLVGGEVILIGLFVVAGTRQTPTLNPSTWTKRGLVAIVLAAIGGTYLGIWLQQTALKFAPTGIAQTLLATSPLFVLPVVALLGEKITLRSLIGVVIAVIGIALLFNT